MAHAPARRRGPAGDEADHWLLAAALGLVFQKLRRILFGRATNLPNHDNRFGLWVGQEHLEHRDEFGAFHWIAADADRGGLAEILAGGLKYGLICERAGARHDSDSAGLEDIARHNADLAFAGCHHPWTIGADEPRLGTRKRTFDLDHVHHG